jgi:hypothetical protein
MNRIILYSKIYLFEEDDKKGKKEDRVTILKSLTKLGAFFKLLRLLRKEEASSNYPQDFKVIVHDIS